MKIFPFMQIGAGMARRVFWLFNTGNMKEILNVLARLEKWCFRYQHALRRHYKGRDYMMLLLALGPWPMASKFFLWWFMNLTDCQNTSTSQTVLTVMYFYVLCCCIWVLFITWIFYVTTTHVTMFPHLKKSILQTIHRSCLLYSSTLFLEDIHCILYFYAESLSQ